RCTVADGHRNAGAIARIARSGIEQTVRPGADHLSAQAVGRDCRPAAFFYAAVGISAGLCFYRWNSSAADAAVSDETPAADALRLSACTAIALSCTALAVIRCTSVAGGNCHRAISHRVLGDTERLAEFSGADTAQAGS